MLTTGSHGSMSCLCALVASASAMRPLSPFAATLDTLLALQSMGTGSPWPYLLRGKTPYIPNLLCLEEGVEGFYNILGVRWGITPSLQLTPAFHSE